MPHLSLKNVSLDYPIYDADSFSLKKKIFQGIPVGGQLRQNQNKSTSILALDNISLTLNKGDRVALFGHNGAGKTSLLKLLAGFYEPTSGHMKCHGNVSALINISAGMDLDLNGYQNIYICGLLYGLTKKEIQDRIDGIAEFSELGAYLGISVRRYSQGMLLRLAFSICTCIECDILLLDETVGAGDQAFIQKARSRLSDLVFRSSILVFATHNIEMAKTLCNKALYLEHGKLAMFGEIDDVLMHIDKIDKNAASINS